MRAVFDILIDGPAYILGGFLGVVAIILPVVMGFGAGHLAQQAVEPKAGRYVGIAAALVIGVWAALIGYRAPHWMAFAMLEYEHRSLSD